MTSDEKSTKPRELVHRAQAQATKWLHELRRARQNLPSSPSVARARREYHDAVMAYWEQIKRFRNRDHIEREWHQEEIRHLGGTLEDISLMRLSDIERETTEKDPNTGAEMVVSGSEPWVMDPQTALAVNDQLDSCAHELGFDADPKDKRETFGWVEQDDDDIAEEVSASGD